MNQAADPLAASGNIPHLSSPRAAHGAENRISSGRVRGIVYADRPAVLPRFCSRRTAGLLSDLFSVQGNAPAFVAPAPHRRLLKILAPHRADAPCSARASPWRWGWASIPIPRGRNIPARHLSAPPRRSSIHGRSKICLNRISPMSCVLMLAPARTPLRGSEVG
jgi:hypothetical protein